MLSPRCTSSLTWRSISAGAACGSTRGLISGGFFAASGGKSHSCVTPTTESPRPTAYKISLSEGSKETIRIESSAPEHVALNAATLNHKSDTSLATSGKQLDHSPNSQ